MKPNTGKKLHFIALGDGATNALEKMCGTYPGARSTAVSNREREAKSPHVTYHDINTVNHLQMVNQLVAAMRDNTCFIMAGIGGMVAKTMLVELWTEMKKATITDYYIIAFHPFKFEGQKRRLNAYQTEHQLIEHNQYYSLHPDELRWLNYLGDCSMKGAFEDLDKRYRQIVDNVLKYKSAF